MAGARFYWVALMPDSIWIASGFEGKIFQKENAMINQWFGIHDGLVVAGRFPSLAKMRERIAASEIILLLICGGAAAATSGFIKMGLRIPGHSIVLSMIPMALGLALAPRRLSGCIMSTGAFSAAFAFNYMGVAHFGSGAFISLCLLGPVMDLAMTKARSGWRLYSGLILAGICTNLLAFGSRSMNKVLGLDFSSMRSFGSWWTEAAITYPLSGAVAGLICALCFFHVRSKQSGIDDFEDRKWKRSGPLHRNRRFGGNALF
jgi:hypothetical protein